MARKSTVQQWEGAECSVVVTSGKHSTEIPKYVARTIGAFIQSIGAIGVWKAKLDECLPGSGTCPEIVLTGNKYDPRTKCFVIAVHPKTEDNGCRGRYRLFVSNEDNSRFDELVKEFERKLTFEKKDRKKSVSKILGNDLDALALLLKHIKNGEQEARAIDSEFLSVNAIEIIQAVSPSLHERHALSWLIKEGYLTVPATAKRCVGKSFVVSVSETADVLINIKNIVIEPEEILQEETSQQDSSQEELSQSISLADIERAIDLLEKEKGGCEKNAAALLENVSEIQRNIDNFTQLKGKREEEYFFILKKVESIAEEIGELKKVADTILRLLK